MNIPNKDTSRPTVLNKGEILQSKKMYRFFKRVQDIFLSFVALILLFPILLVVTVIVFIDVPNACPIFVQERIGKNGKKFKLYKFRTMIPNAEDELESLLEFNEMDGHAFKMKNDPRITKIGKLLRKSSLDELPQLINILKGDMSIVGPRPPIQREVNQYDEYDMQRLYVTPGLTCYWQILPDRNEVPFEQWVELDIEYIKDRSLLTDWKIIFKTFTAVFKMNGI